MGVADELRAAAHSADPYSALRIAVIRWRDAGGSKAEVLTALNGLLAAVRATSTESPLEDAVLDTLDSVVGWCHPTLDLFPTDNATAPR